MGRRVGIVGFGNLGKFLYSKINESEELEIAFVWNRTKSSLDDCVQKDEILDDLVNFRSKNPDIVVEVAHPNITKLYGTLFLEYCDYMIGSPTALCDEDLLHRLSRSAVDHGLYVPSGAFWGGEDISKLSDAGMLSSLRVTMIQPKSSLKLEGELKQRNETVNDIPLVLYEGPVRGVCALAPNNTNTMALAALAASKLGFDGVHGCLISDPNERSYHTIEIEAQGPQRADGAFFSVHTVRKNPAIPGQVTGIATYTAYYGSLKKAKNKGAGLHLC